MLNDTGRVEENSCGPICASTYSSSKGHDIFYRPAGSHNVGPDPPTFYTDFYLEITLSSATSCPRTLHL